jgi:hypothetical protein
MFYNIGPRTALKMMTSHLEFFIRSLCRLIDETLITATSSGSFLVVLVFFIDTYKAFKT